jgi:hypothetical protein
MAPFPPQSNIPSPQPAPETISSNPSQNLSGQSLCPHNWNSYPSLASMFRYRNNSLKKYLSGARAPCRAALGILHFMLHDQAD